LKSLDSRFSPRWRASAAGHGNDGKAIYKQPLFKK
jgi:hypothetical protein